MVKHISAQTAPPKPENAIAFVDKHQGINASSSTIRLYRMGRVFNDSIDKMAWSVPGTALVK
jgi:hypothetical protein